MKKNKKIICLAFVIIFLIISYFLLNNYIKNINDKSYSKWMDTAFKLIMKQAKNKNCDTVSIKNDFEEIKLINIDCLQ